MLVERADIDTADDGVCVKGTTGNAHVVNVTVRASRVRSRSSAVKFGSACGVAMRNLLFEDLHLRDSNRGLALQARDGGAIADVVFRRIVIDGTRWWPRNWWGDGGALYISTMLRDAGDPVECARAYDAQMEGDGSTLVAHRLEVVDLHPGGKHGLQIFHGESP